MTSMQPRYSVTVRRELIAQHFLVGGDWGRESMINSHQYRIEARYEGTSLDRHGFLLDIDEINRKLDVLVERYRDNTLNELPEFEGLNPSVENFCRILSDQLLVTMPNIDALEVTVWEDTEASAAYRRPLGANARA
ncbi:MAG: 6-carboxytetrahydropterin synthase [Pseudonocardiales bacterium]|nr:6-carboxytetrahydropterin synthase [Pseudonocardiales bacterium]MBV9649007.1 6-carboxytetrahydropterin synthase [Pseudonocardiales bacterium]